MSKEFIVVVLLSATLIMSGCTSDELEPPAVDDCSTIDATYDLNIKEIVDRSCAYSGCHLDSAPGNFTTYDGMLQRLNNGLIRQRVITLAADPNSGMPPNYAPADRPLDLTPEELELFRCWLDNGFPEQ